MSYSTVVNNVEWPHTYCTCFILVHLAICVVLHVYCFLVCIYLNVCVLVTVLPVTVSVMKEQDLLLMV